MIWHVLQVIPRAPYVPTKEFMNILFHDHKIDYIVHGDDPCLLPDGSDVYDYPKQIGRFRMVKRTEGVSTTDIVGRMLMCGKSNRLVRDTFKEQQRDMLRRFGSSHGRNTSVTTGVTEDGNASGDGSAAGGSGGGSGGAQRISSFLPTSRRIVQFSSGKSAPPNAHVVYIDGAFDMFHNGHLAILEKAKQLGDYLIVGVHSDEAVTARRGPHLPIMSVHERCLSVLACQLVDEVVIGALPCPVVRILLLSASCKCH